MVELERKLAEAIMVPEEHGEVYETLYDQSTASIKARNIVQTTKVIAAIRYDPPVTQACHKAKVFGLTHVGSAGARVTLHHSATFLRIFGDVYSPALCRRCPRVEVPL